MRLRAIVALFAAAVATLAAPAAAHAAVQYPPTLCASLSVSTTQPLPGEEITVSGVNFLPDASVRLELHSTTYHLKTVTSDGAGTFTTNVKLPDGVFGTHRIVATSGAPTGSTCPSEPFVVIHIQRLGTAGSSASTPGHHGGTSFTGVDVLLILIAAALLIGVGVALNRGGKRRHSGSGHPMID
jgi:hypothetical protein